MCISLKAMEVILSPTISHFSPMPLYAPSKALSMPLLYMFYIRVCVCVCVWVCLHVMYVTYSVPGSTKREMCQKLTGRSKYSSSNLFWYQNFRIAHQFFDCWTCLHSCRWTSWEQYLAKKKQWSTLTLNKTDHWWSRVKWTTFRPSSRSTIWMTVSAKRFFPVKSRLCFTGGSIIHVWYRWKVLDYMSKLWKIEPILGGILSDCRKKGNK